MVAAGSRDHLVYLWRVRPDQMNEDQEEEKGRAMRRYTATQLSGHRVSNLANDYNLPCRYFGVN